jgi:hypothetical protein
MRRPLPFCRPLKRAANLEMPVFPRLKAAGYGLKPASLAQTVSRTGHHFRGPVFRSAFAKLVSLHLPVAVFGVSSMNVPTRQRRQPSGRDTISRVTSEEHIS